MKDYETGLTAEEVRQMFKYKRTTGELIRKLDVPTRGQWCRYLKGSVAGSLHADGYVYVGFKKRLYMAHRLIWLIETGQWPRSEIDHHDGVRSNNKWKNLRDASVAQNRQNTLGQRTRQGPYPGVYEPAARPGRFNAQIKHKGEVIYLGTFSDPEGAYFARLAAEHALFGEFAGSRRP